MRNDDRVNNVESRRSESSGWLQRTESPSRTKGNTCRQNSWPWSVDYGDKRNRHSIWVTPRHPLQSHLFHLIHKHSKLKDSIALPATPSELLHEIKSNLFHSVKLPPQLNQTGEYPWNHFLGARGFKHEMSIKGKQTFCPSVSTALRGVPERRCPRARKNQILSRIRKLLHQLGSSWQMLTNCHPFQT